MVSHLEEQYDDDNGYYPDDRKMQQYANLFFLLQSEPRHIATLCRLVNLSEIDTLLQTVMFTLYGNQYESREEHLLLTMFQVRHRLFCVYGYSNNKFDLGPPFRTSLLRNSKLPLNSVRYLEPIPQCLA